MEKYFTILAKNEVKGEDRALAVAVTTSRNLMAELKKFVNEDEVVDRVYPMKNLRIAQFVATEYMEYKNDPDLASEDIDVHVKRVTENWSFEYTRQDPMPDTDVLFTMMNDAQKESLSELDMSIEKKLDEMKEMLERYVPDGTYVEDIEAVKRFYHRIASDFIDIY